MRVLITGITGMVGSHFAEMLLERGDVEVYGTYRWRSRMDNIAHIQEKLHLVECDLTDAWSTDQAIAKAQPDRIFHLAAQSFVPMSWQAPAATFQSNVIGQLNLLEAVRKAGLDPLIHVAGSSEEYGLVYPHETPIKETNPLRPLSPYAVSKVGQEMLAYQYHMSYRMRTIVTRGFNHTGPRRGEVFATSNFAKQIARIEKGLNPPVIRVGNLSARRDWSDVRDMVRAYWALLDKGIPGEVYNIGCGKAYVVGDMLEILLGMSKVKITVEQDPARMRPSDVEILIADMSKFQDQTGWAPTIPFEQTMKDLLNYWRERV